MAQAGCHKPLRREPARGPQHPVKPAASSDLQPESRAGDFAAKAMSVAPQSGGVRATGLGGVEGAARVHGGERNTRGPSAQLRSGQRGSYKPTAKASAAQRESERVVVPQMVATNNAIGGKDPRGGQGGEARTREGMTGRTGSNHPGGRSSTDQVRQLQRRLWVAAKRSPERRFHATRSWIGSGGVTSFRKLGGGSNGIVARPASIGRRWAQSSSTASSACSTSSAPYCAQAGIARRRSCGDTSRKPMAGSGRWVFRPSETECRRWRRRSCWSRSLRRIFAPPRLASGRSEARRRPSNSCVSMGRVAGITCWTRTSATTSAASITRSS